MKISKEKLKQIIKEELTKVLSEAENMISTANIEKLLPEAEKVCSLLPVQCCASIQFLDEDGEDRQLNPALIEADEVYAVCLVISFGDAPSIDYNEDIFALYDDGEREITGMLAGGEKDIDVNWLLDQSKCSSYEELDPVLIEFIDNSIGYNAELKLDQVVDVDLD